MLMIVVAQRSSANVLYSEALNEGQKYGNVALLNPFNRNSVEFE